ANLDARHVNAVRLFAEDMFARVNRRLEHLRDEMRCRRDDHHIHTAGIQLYVSVKAYKAMTVLDINLIRLGLLQLFAAVVQTFLEHICERDKAYILARIHCVYGRASATVAATDQSNPQNIAASRVGTLLDGQRAECRATRQDGGGF